VQTLAEMPIRFDEPWWLLLLLLLVPCFVLAQRSISGQGRVKATVTFALRTLVIFALALALAHPIWEKKGEGLTVSIILDRSQSIPAPLKRQTVEFLQRAAEAKENREDRVAVITVARDANITAMPDRLSAVDAGGDDGDVTATNLAAGLRMALAIMPDDTANRIVLASDGNETVESVLAAAEIARANNVPVDVLIPEYEHGNEVIFERLVAPARARQGQSVSVKMALRSQADTTGTVYLSMNGEPLDLNGDETGDGLRIALEPGLKVVPVTIGLDTGGPQEFEAIFEPDDPRSDMIDRNNSAVAVTFVGHEGKVLIIESEEGEGALLARAMKDADIEIDVADPDAALAGGIVALSAYDAVVLATTPRWGFSDEQDRALHAYVHDLGGGLVMLGGPESFGAGGWIDSELAKTLPVKLDPPQTRQMPRGALALIMHSCEMPQGNYWGQQVAIAAINALSRLDYVGIVEYNWNPGVQNVNGASWAYPMQVVGDKGGAIAAAKKMVVGDMPDFSASMTLAISGPGNCLTSVRAGQKHAIIISDGDPSPPSKALLNQYVAEKVTVTTIMVAGHGSAIDRSRMQQVAQTTGGRFYNITNPRQLPQIFIKEAQIVSRSLIQEGEVYRPQIVSRLPGPIDGFSAVPALEGYILTARREGLAQTPIAVATMEEGQATLDPVYAHWNYGLGKTIAFTSDLAGRWGAQWAGWAEFQAFWEQSMRWVMRPSSPSNMLVNTRIEGDRAIVEIEALEADASYMNFMSMNAVVINPDTSTSRLPLHQTGPGKYRGEFSTEDAGAYLMNINYAGGSSESAVEGNLQAAVTVPYSREFRAVKHNAVLLTELADQTGGRVLRAGDAALVDLFDAEDLEIPRSAKQVWDLIVIIAASLFIFDVAARRLAIEREWVVRVLRRAVGQRTEATAETVAAWKRARAQVAHRRMDRPAERKARFEASEADASVAIDVGSEAPKDVSAPAAAPKRAPAAPEQADDEEEGGDYTSRLLAAKRRARGDKGRGDKARGDKDGDDA
jgi:uncharacterized membrane protein